MRIIKSVSAVLVCFLIYELRGRQGAPFYSALAVLQCMQPYHNKTLSVASNRIRGTLTGAFWGIVLILLELYIFPYSHSSAPCHYLLTALLTGCVLYTTVILKITQSSYFSCVVFLSIVVNHIADASPWLFVLNRVLDTMIGIIVAFAINELIRLPREKHNDILFVAGIDDALLNHQNKLLPYSEIELNRIIESGARFTVSTLWTPASIRETLGNITFHYPVIVMNGAALYDMRENTYLLTDVLSVESTAKAVSVLEKENINYYSNVIIDDTLLIYCKAPSNAADQQMYTKLKNSPYRNYIHTRVPAGVCVVYFMIIDSTDNILSLYERLLERLGTTEYKMIHYESKDFPGASYIKIYAPDVSREKMLRQLKERLNIKKSLTFGSIEGHCDVLIRDSNYNHMVKLLKKYYEPIRFLKKRG